MKKAKVSFELAGSALPIVNNYTFLWVQFSSMLSFSAHLESKLAKAKKAIAALLPVLFLMPANSARLVYAGMIEPIVEYAGELWRDRVCQTTQDHYGRLRGMFAKKWLRLPLAASNHLATKLLDERYDELDAFFAPAQHAKPHDRALFAQVLCNNQLHHLLCSSGRCFDATDECICVLCSEPAGELHAARCAFISSDFLSQISLLLHR